MILVAFRLQIRRYRVDKPELADILLPEMGWLVPFLRIGGCLADETEEQGVLSR